MPELKYYCYDINGNLIECTEQEASFVKLDSWACSILSPSYLDGIKQQLKFDRYWEKLKIQDVTKSENMQCSIIDEIEQTTFQIEERRKDIEVIRREIEETNRRIAPLKRIVRQLVQKTWKGAYKGNPFYLICPGGGDTNIPISDPESGNIIYVKAWITLLESTYVLDVDESIVREIVDEEISDIWSDEDNTLYKTELYPGKGIWCVRLYSSYRPNLPYPFKK